MKKSTVDIIEMCGTTTDNFWSEGLVACLAEGIAVGSLRDGVLSSIELWRENVLVAFADNFGIQLDWVQVGIKYDSPLIEELFETTVLD